MLNPFINCFSAWYRYIGDLSAERRIFAFAERVERLDFYMLNSDEFFGRFAYSLKCFARLLKPGIMGQRRVFYCPRRQSL
ncbi:MAG: hypothetical protein ACLR56_14865 [Oscillospiraceae bacterium]